MMAEGGSHGFVTRIRMQLTKLRSRQDLTKPVSSGAPNHGVGILCQLPNATWAGPCNGSAPTAWRGSPTCVAQPRDSLRIGSFREFRIVFALQPGRRVTQLCRGYAGFPFKCGGVSYTLSCCGVCV